MPGDTAVYAAAQLDATSKTVNACIIYYFPGLSCLFILRWKLCRVVLTASNLEIMFPTSITVFQCYGTTSINTCCLNMLQPGAVSM